MQGSTRHTCLRLEIGGNQETQVFYVKGTWYPTHFSLSITDGFSSWLCNASEQEVAERANQWDQPVKEYLETAEEYLGFRQPSAVYACTDAGDGYKRLSWTFEKQGTKLEWRWKCQPSSNNKQDIAGILDFLMDSNIRLSEEVVKKTRSFESMKVEAEKCLVQSETLRNEKEEFESTIYAKFVTVLNSKKAKLRELRDRLSRIDTMRGSDEDEDQSQSSNETEIYNEESDDEESKGVKENAASTSMKDHKRKTQG